MKTVNTVMSGMAALGMLLSGAAQAVNYSGFLDDYPMHPDPDRDGAMVYFKPGFSLAAYDKVMIAPITIFIHPESEYKAIDPDEMKALTDSFYNALVEALEPDYPVVSKPGPGVILLRLAITDVLLKKEKKKRGLLGYTPVGLAASAVKSAVSNNISLQEAVIEGEMSDAQTGEVMGVLVDAEPHMTDATTEPSPEAILQSFKFYGERLRQRMDAAHAGK